MKKLNTILFLCLFAISSCDQDEGQVEPTLMDKIVQNWQLLETGYVKASGVNITDTFTALSFTFRADGTYSSIVNEKHTDGVWRATDSSISTIILDEVVPVNVLELTESRLLVSFSSIGMINGRSKGVSTFEVLLSAE